MSESKMTPGPWVWRGKSGSLHRVGDPPYPFGETVMRPSYEYDSGVDIEFPNKANCHLITAAPDLFEALDQMTKVIEAAGAQNLARGVQLGQISWYAKITDALSAAHYALAKARGES